MDAITRYDILAAEYLRSAKRRELSPQSVNNYTRGLSLFREYLIQNPPSGETVDYSDITGYADFLTDNGRKASTIKQRLVLLGQFFNFATKPYIKEEFRYDHNPVNPDFYPKVKQTKIGEILPDKAIIKLWDYECRYEGPCSMFPRNYAIVVLILATGLRNKEVLGLSLSDVDWEYGEITVRNGKGGKSRIVDAPDIVLTALSLYLRAGIRPDGISDDAPLFGTYAAHEFGASRYGETWHSGSSQWLSELIENHVKQQTGGYTDVRSHDLRHLFARISLNATGNLAELQGLMGHSSPVTTERYSQRIQNHRVREGKRAVLSARNAAAEKLREKLAEVEAKEKVPSKKMA